MPHKNEASRCIEGGVDNPTVSQWLGCNDGGALATKVYGHLRNQHSASMARLVNFAPTESNIVPLPDTTLIPKRTAIANPRRKTDKAEFLPGETMWPTPLTSD